jgi:hypothetical protein
MADQSFENRLHPHHQATDSSSSRSFAVKASDYEVVTSFLLSLKLLYEGLNFIPSTLLCIYVKRTLFSVLLFFLL